MIIAHHNDASLPVNPLSMKLNGILDAAVMGGITNYEKVTVSFFLFILNSASMLDAHFIIDENI